MHTFPFYCNACADVTNAHVEFPNGATGVAQIVCPRGHRWETED